MSERALKQLPRHTADNGRVSYDLADVFSLKRGRAEARDASLKRLHAELVEAEATLAAEAPPLHEREAQLRAAVQRVREPRSQASSNIERALRGEAPAPQPTAEDRERLVRELVKEIDAVRAQIAALEARPIEIAARIAKRKAELAMRACDSLVRLTQLVTLEYLKVQADADREIDAACLRLDALRGTPLASDAIRTYHELREPLVSVWRPERETNAPCLVDKLSIVINLRGEPIAQPEPDEGDEVTS